MMQRRTANQRLDDAHGALAFFQKHGQTVWFKFDSLALACVAEKLGVSSEEAFILLGGEAYGIGVNIPEG